MAKKKTQTKVLIGVAVDENGAIDVRHFPNPTKGDAKLAESIREYNELDGAETVEISIFEVNLNIPKGSVKKAKAKKVKTVKVDNTPEDTSQTDDNDEQPD